MTMVLKGVIKNLRINDIIGKNSSPETIEKARNDIYKDFKGEKDEDEGHRAQTSKSKVEGEIKMSSNAINVSNTDSPLLSH